MTTSEQTNTKPLWLSIEEKFLGLASQDISEESLEASVQRIAGELDETGYNVSHHGGNMLKLRWAIDNMRKVGKPLMQDINDAISALALEDVAEPFVTSDKLITEIGNTWPGIRNSEYRTEVVQMVQQAKLDLLVAKAKGLPDDQGVRMLIEEKIDSDIIISALEINQEKYDQVIADIKAELAEIARVETLLKAVEGKTDDERVRHLYDNNVSEALIIEMANVDQNTIDGVKKAMEEELKEKQRLAEEEAARKKAEAEGPSLDSIPPDQMIDYIDSIREILEFSDQEKEIRVMCEQSAIPKALVDIAVSEPDRLDELEKAAQ
jgi:hypothetical protein